MLSDGAWGHGVCVACVRLRLVGCVPGPSSGGFLGLCGFLRCCAAASLYGWGLMAAVNQRYCAP
ncbi:hypothetical protein HmCmsJML040_03789 [Escherichia coli]|nr:hypothetical protein HmCmsJML040_03789 [Escherichia coli]